MRATNISIIQQCSVSIYVETLQAIKQRVLSVTDNFSLLPYRAKFLTLGNRQARFTLLSLNRNFHFSLIRLYRQELRMAHAVARVIDKHPTLSNIALWLMGIGIMVEIFLYA